MATYATEPEFTGLRTIVDGCVSFLDASLSGTQHPTLVITAPLTPLIYPYTVLVHTSTGIFENSFSSFILKKKTTVHTSTVSKKYLSKWKHNWSTLHAKPTGSDTMLTLKPHKEEDVQSEAWNKANTARLPEAVTSIAYFDASVYQYSVRVTVHVCITV